MPFPEGFESGRPGESHSLYLGFSFKTDDRARFLFFGEVLGYTYVPWKEQEREEGEADGQAAFNDE